MTKLQAKLIARELRNALRDAESPCCVGAIESLMIDLANAINSTSVRFNRDEFLRECNHRQWRKPS